MTEEVTSIDDNAEKMCVCINCREVHRLRTLVDDEVDLAKALVDLMGELGADGLPEAMAEAKRLKDLRRVNDDKIQALVDERNAVKEAITKAIKGQNIGFLMQLPGFEGVEPE